MHIAYSVLTNSAGSLKRYGVQEEDIVGYLNFAGPYGQAIGAAYELYKGQSDQNEMNKRLNEISSALNAIILGQKIIIQKLEKLPDVIREMIKEQYIVGVSNQIFASCTIINELLRQGFQTNIVVRDELYKEIIILKRALYQLIGENVDTSIFCFRVVPCAYVMIIASLCACTNDEKLVINIDDIRKRIYGYFDKYFFDSTSEDSLLHKLNNVEKMKEYCTTEADEYIKLPHFIRNVSLYLKNDPKIAERYSGCGEACYDTEEICGSLHLNKVGKAYCEIKRGDALFRYTVRWYCNMFEKQNNRVLYDFELVGKNNIINFHVPQRYGLPELDNGSLDKSQIRGHFWDYSKFYFAACSNFYHSNDKQDVDIVWCRTQSFPNPSPNPTLGIPETGMKDVMFKIYENDALKYLCEIEIKSLRKSLETACLTIPKEERSTFDHCQQYPN